MAQTPVLPVLLSYNADASKPLVIYISGDGGWNKFSKAFVNELNANGYAVVGLDAKDYFWKKKTPQQAAGDVNRLAVQYLQEWKKAAVVFIGYSFGGDVLPFIFNRSSADVQSRTKNIVLLSPSATTDFEVHVSDWLGIHSDRGANVVAEINKLTKNVVLLLSSDEDDFPLNQLTIRNKQVIILSGGHHYAGDVKGLVKHIVDKLK